MAAGLRILIIWLIALAIPVQGMAAATMRFCAPTNQARSAVPQAAAGAHHHAPGVAAHHAHHAAPEVGPGDASDVPGHVPQTASKMVSKMKCSACAACCMASALPPSRVTVPVVKPLFEATQVVTTRYVGPDVAGLERPPKPELI